MNKRATDYKVGSFANKFFFGFFKIIALNSWQAVLTPEQFKQYINFLLYFYNNFIILLCVL